MTRDEILALLARRADAWRRLDVGTLVSDYAADAVIESPLAGGTTQGLEQIKQVFQTYFIAFPDLGMDVGEVLVDGQRAAVMATFASSIRYGDGRSLHAACVRALEEAARRRISGYAALEPNERSAALARVTSFDRESLAAAIHHPRMRTAGELHRTIALLEAARRETLMRRRNSHDGTR